jgi:hypothetical protein
MLLILLVNDDVHDMHDDVVVMIDMDCHELMLMVYDNVHDIDVDCHELMLLMKPRVMFNNVCED